MRVNGAAHEVLVVTVQCSGVLTRVRDAKGDCRHWSGEGGRDPCRWGRVVRR
jgi:hypothetical protein